MKKYVLGFAFSQDLDKVILIEKQHPEYFKGKFNGVGGKIEQDESPFEAMLREFEEETSIITDNWESIGNMYRKDEWHVSLFKTILSDKQISQLKTTTDENVYSIHIMDIFSNQLKTMDHLQTLIAFCLKKERKEIAKIEIRYE